MAKHFPISISQPLRSTKSAFCFLLLTTVFSSKLYAQSKDFTPIHTLVQTDVLSQAFVPVTGIPDPGQKPSHIAVGDFNGDGKPDLAIANEASNTVSIFKNITDNSGVKYELTGSLPTGEATQSVRVGDVNGDAKLDMVVASYNASSLDVFVNTSGTTDISFAPSIQISSIDCPFFADIADIDGDGKADIIFPHKQTGKVMMALNQSAGATVSFSSPISIGEVTTPYFLAIGDLNKDGKQDVVVAGYGANKVLVYKNMSTVGSVSFDTPIELAATTPYGITLADLDQDGQLDIVTSNLLGGTISIFSLDNAGNLSFKARQDIAAGVRIYATAVGDLDGDSKPDLAITNYYGTAALEPTGIVLLKNTSTAGTIQFVNEGELSAGPPSHVAINDVDGDGKNEIISVDYVNSKISIFTSGQPLPVAFNLFKAELVNGGEVLLNWDTFSESNNSHFNIFSSVDGVNYKFLKTVKGNGTKTTRSYYSTVDASPAQGYNYYKLEQVDFNGTTTKLSEQVVNVNLDRLDVVLYPNPSEDFVNIRIEANSFNHAELIGLSGSILQSQNIAAGVGLVSFDVAQLKPATYLVKLSGSAKSITKIFVKK